MWCSYFFLFVVLAQLLTLSSASTRYESVRALCLGCSKGVGRATAIRLLEGGAKLVACSRSLNNLGWLDGMDNGFKTICNVEDKDAFNKVVNFTISKIGSINAVFYVPCYTGQGDLMDTFEFAEMDQIIDNAQKHFIYEYEGPLRTIKAALPELKKYGGSVVTLSSIAASWKLATNARVINYGAFKDAQTNFMKKFARTFAEYSIRFNVARLGLVKSNAFDNFPIEIKNMFFNEMLWRTPLGRNGEVNDVANLLTFLLSNESNWITGQLITIDGGIELTNMADGLGSNLVPKEQFRDFYEPFQKNVKDKMDTNDDEAKQKKDL